MMKLAKPFYVCLSNVRTIAGREAFNVNCRRITGSDIRVILVADYAGLPGWFGVHTLVSGSHRR
jgi:hypothetical protein